MNNFIRKFIHGRNSKLNVLLILSVAAIVGLGCFGSGRNKDAKPIPAAFLGEWEGQDGSTLAIRGDGTGDYISGGTEIKGGTAEVNEADKTVSITFFGIGKTLKIDSPPMGDTMKLDGVTYRRVGGSTETTANTDSDKTTKKNATPEPVIRKANASKGEIPEDEELQQMAKRDLLAFNDAVQDGDFTEFHSKISKLWQKQTTPERFNQAFAQFIEKKIDISEISSETATFSPEPSIETEASIKKLIVEGRYPTYAPPVKFVLKYIPEGKEWKLFGIEVDTTGR